MKVPSRGRQYAPPPPPPRQHYIPHGGVEEARMHASLSSSLPQTRIPQAGSYTAPQVPLGRLRETNNIDPFYDRPDPNTYYTQDYNEEDSMADYAANIKRYEEECEKAIEAIQGDKQKRDEFMDKKLGDMTVQADHSEKLLHLYHIGYFPTDISRPRWNTLSGRLPLQYLHKGMEGNNVTKHLVIAGDTIKHGGTTFGVEDAEVRLKNAVLSEINVKFLRNKSPVSLALTVYRKYGNVEKPLSIRGTHNFNINERCHFLSHADSVHTKDENIYRNEPSANHPLANMYPDLSSDMASISKGVIDRHTEILVPDSHVIMNFLAGNMHLRQYKQKGWVWPQKSADHEGYYRFPRAYYDDVANEISLFVEENFPVTDLTTLSFHFIPTTDPPDDYDVDRESCYVDFSIQLLYGLRGVDV